jgi:ubiquinone biosynthesis protein
MVMVEGVATMLDPGINMWDVSGPYVKAWLRDELGPEAKLADAIFDGLETLKRLPGLLKRLEDDYPPPGGAPPPLPLPDIQLIDVSRGGGLLRYGLVAVIAAAIGAAAMWGVAHW